MFTRGDGVVELIAARLAAAAEVRFVVSVGGEGDGDDTLGDPQRRPPRLRSESGTGRTTDQGRDPDLQSRRFGHCGSDDHPRRGVTTKLLERD